MEQLTLEQRITAFATLGRVMLQAAGEEVSLPYGDEVLVSRLSAAVTGASRANPWFDAENVRRSLLALGRVLTEENLQKWTGRYPRLTGDAGSREVVVIMAGNIPLVGFHDMLSVLIAGHRLIARSSSRDAGLHRLAGEILSQIEPAFAPYLRFTRERPAKADAVIATGSDNTARYFDYYYKNIPAIIRRNRNSLAILDGKESEEELTGLAGDIFWYYGLGCRNVSKLFIPEGYDLERLFPYFRQHNRITSLPAYRHNLEYRRALFRISGQPFLDAGNLLLTPGTPLASPIGVLYYETYKDLNHASTYVGAYVDKIQCTVAHEGLLPGTILPGKAQFPELWDYADGVDTMEFLNHLKD